MKIFLAIILFTITVSVACDASRLAGSQSPANSNSTPAQSPAQTSNSSGEEKPACQLTLAGAPDIKGLRLGMTADEVLALFPGSKEDAEVRSNLSRPASQLGESEFVIRSSNLEANEKFAGVKQIVVSLVDGRTSRFYIGYNGPEYSHVDKFVAKFIEGTSLPPVDQWEAYVGMDTQLKTLKCTEFEIKVFSGGQGGILNYVDIRDLEADKKVEDRRKKAEGKAKPPAQ
jgi:hypothetical protein